ncbi:MAG: sensor histidine kinase [Desulfovibrionaceae bacterium]
MLFTHGLRFKFISIVLLCVSGTILFTAYYILEKERALLMNNARQQALSMTRASAILFTNTFIYEELEMLDASDMVDYLSYYVTDVMRTDPRILAFTVTDKHGRVVAHNDAPEPVEGNPGFGDQAEPSLRVIGTGMDARMEVVEPLAIESKRWGACRLVFSLADIERARLTARNEVLAISGACLLVSVIFIGFGVDYLVKSLQRLSEAMEGITVDEDFSRPFPELPTRRDEIGQLQQSFKWMVHRLRREEQERVRTKERMFHTEKMATIGQLTASIAHEVNNPLAGVMLCFNNLTRGGMDEETRERHVEVINNGLERIQKIMRDLLDYSRQSSLNIEPADPAAVVRKSVSLLELFLRKRGITLETALPKDAPPVPLDASKIQQVLVNLLVNAIHAMPGGGTIRMGGELDAEYFTFIISDTGTGIPEDIREKIFDPFYTTKDVGEGTGLGLALAKSVVEQHGGRLALRRSDSTGSVFAISLPLMGKDS